MKNKLSFSVIIMMLFTSVIIFCSDKSSQNNPPKNGKSKNINVKQNESNFFIQQSPGREHSKQKLNCKSCHNCEYPTKEDPCLVYCPREGMISVHHTPDECPEIITLDQMSTRFGAVVFSHKVHAQMAEMSDGCQGCHHYNTTGPVLACRKCHVQKRHRDNIKRIDLKGAYHRQCMSCHRQWSHTTDCNSCHIPKGPGSQKKIVEKIRKISGKKHPETVMPNLLIFDTKFKKGRLVTFYHEDHVKIFGATCNSCHFDESCIKCHDWNNKMTHSLLEAQKVHKAKISFKDHHKRCQGCHTQDKCDVCHSDKQKEPWNHDKATKFALKHYHEKLSCENCHNRKTQFQKLSIDCKNCHRNWKLGKFDHKVTGLALSDSHKEMECEECHSNLKYTQKPACSNCHDDKSFPKHIPGKMLISQNFKSNHKNQMRK